MTRETTAAYVSANDAAHFDEVIFAELQFASGTSYVCTREHDVDWNSITWAGKGQVGTIEPIEEAGELEPLGIAMTLKVSAELLALALDPSEYKNRTAKIWRGLFGPDMVDLDWAGDPDGATALFEGMGGTITRSGATATRVNESGLIETVAADTLRIDYDPVTLECKGALIEEARTNRCARSAEIGGTGWVSPGGSGVTITANTDVAPDGTTTADTVTDSSAVVNGRVQYNYATASSTTTRCASWFVKKTSGDSHYAALITQYTSGGTPVAATAVFNTNTGEITATASAAGSGVEDFGDYWRVWCAATDNATGNTVLACQLYPSWNTTGAIGGVAGTTGSKVAWGLQIEDAAFPTSYIPTAGSAVARNADQPADGDISDWFNNTEGTVLVEAMKDTDKQTSAFPWLWSVNEGVGTNEMGNYIAEASDAAAFLVRDAGGVTQAQPSLGTVAANTPFRIANAYKENDFAASKDGAAVSTDSSGTVPTCTTLWLGRGDSYLNGHLRRFTYYPHRLGNDVLEALSAGTLDPAAAARGRKIVADPVGPFTFRMDSLEFELGRTGTLRLTAEGRLADWQRPRVRYYNDADQQSEFPGDNFFANTEEFVEKTLIW